MNAITFDFTRDPEGQVTLSAPQSDIVFDLSKVPMATRLAILDDHNHQLETKGRSYWSELPHERKGFRMLGVGRDAKTTKGEKLGVDTAILYLSPATNATAKGETLCSHAVIAGCLKACLYTAGRGRMSSVAMSRLYRTLLFTQKHAVFMAYLEHEIEMLALAAQDKGRKLAVRLNGTSDIDFTSVAWEFPEVQFYDYTKCIDRLGHTPANYHLTASYSGKNADYARDVLAKVEQGHNAAVVFRNRAQAEHAIAHGWQGFRGVVDGDETDARFLDPQATSGPGYIVALYAKGAAKDDRSGFVVDLHEGAR